MSNIITLTKLLFKSTNFDIVSSQNKKKKSSIIGKVLIGLLLIYSFGVIALMFYFISNELILGFGAYGLEGVALELLLLIASFVIFFFAIFMVPTVFYFSDDVQVLLPLPLKPYEIFVSKFIVTLFYEYATVAIVYIPIVVAYVMNVNVTALFYLQAIVLGLLLPILPLVLGMLLIMVLMRFSKIMRNRDRFNMIVGSLYFVIAMGFGMYVGSMDQETSSRLILSIIENKNAIGVITKFIPSIGFAVKGIVDNNLISFVISIIIPLAVVYLVSLLSNALYFKGVIGINDTGSRRKKLNEASFNKALNSKGVLWTYTKKEMALLFRTPTYFMNCILSNFVWFLMGGILYISFILSNDPEINEVISQIQRINLVDYMDIYQTDLLIVALGVSIAMGAMTSCMNSIASTAISREGVNYEFMKYIPVSYRKQLDAKALSSIIISSLGSLPILFICIWYLKLPILYYAIALIGSSIGCVFLGYLGLLIDVLHPKLLWDNEKVAVKNNLNSILVMVITISFVITYVVLLFKLSVDMFAGIMAVIVAIIVLSIILYIVIEKVANKKFSKL